MWSDDEYGIRTNAARVALGTEDARELVVVCGDVRTHGATLCTLKLVLLLTVEGKGPC